MTLDEAIRHELWCARESQGDTAEEHMQMAEWLCELRRLRESGENAKLRELLRDMSKAFLTLDIDHCQACPRDKDNCRCQMFVAADGECAFVTEMRELGIEVNDE